MQENDLEVTTPPEDIEKAGELDRFLAHTATSNKSFVVRDRTGLRLSFAGLLPITTGDNGEQRIWGASIILNSAELEFPKVKFKLRASAKKSMNPQLICNKSKGSIKPNDIFVLTYQLPESSIGAVNLTLLVDGSPHEVPLCKIHKADYYWIGKETSVPSAAQLHENRRVFAPASPKMEPTPKNVSPGRFEHLSEGLRAFLLGENGIDSVCKLLHPHAISLFRDLASAKLTKFETSGFVENENLTDVIAEEIVHRFHKANRANHPTTPAMLQ